MATIQNARMGYYQRQRLAASEKGQRMANARWKEERVERAATPPDVDADTLRSRALHDRMGKLILAGTHVSLGHVEVRHSTRRTNGFELWIEGQLSARAGKRKIMEELL